MSRGRAAPGLLVLAALLAGCAPAERDTPPAGAARLPSAPPAASAPYQPYSYGTSRPDPWPPPGAQPRPHPTPSDP